MGLLQHPIGQVLNGTYRIERLIGEGGVGAVYEASHERLDRRFAVKVLLPRYAECEEAFARFRREARVTSAIGHPHIVEVVDFHTLPDGTPYLVMELLEGEDLGTRLERVRRFDLEACASILEQTASGLEAAHEHGVVHRDLKPQNLFLCRRGRLDDFVKVVDFGMSKILDSKSGLTAAQALIGTPWYMAPEQAEQRASEADRRTDVYATGVILYELLAGQPPFDGTSAFEVLHAVVRTPPPPLRRLRPEVPSPVEEVVHRALSKKPDDRQASMARLADEFLEAAGLSTSAVAAPARARRAPPTDEAPPTVEGAPSDLATHPTLVVSPARGDDPAFSATVAVGAVVDETSGGPRPTTPRPWKIVVGIALALAIVALGLAAYLLRRGDRPSEAAGPKPSVTSAPGRAPEVAPPSSELAPREADPRPRAFRPPQDAPRDAGLLPPAGRSPSGKIARPGRAVHPRAVGRVDARPPEEVRQETPPPLHSPPHPTPDRAAVERSIALAARADRALRDGQELAAEELLRKAQRLAREALQADPANARAALLVGKAACLLGSTEEARRIFGQLAGAPRAELKALCASRRVVLP
jgi:eukaryotic-like serine/threonine-protein kinase